MEGNCRDLSGGTIPTFASGKH